MTRRLLALGVSLSGPPLHATVDRIEGDFAVLELDLDHFTELPLSLLPADLREGEGLRLRRSATHLHIRRCRPRGRPPHSSPPRPAQIRAPRRIPATQTGEST